MTETTALLPEAECGALVAASVEQPKATEDLAVSFSQAMMGLYRASDFLDPKLFAAGLSANFAEFPASICRQVCDPVRGLAVRLKFPPTIAEVRAALDDALAKRRTIAYRAGWMIEERRRREEEDTRRAKKDAISAEDRAALVQKLRGSIQSMPSSDIPSQTPKAA